VLVALLDRDVLAQLAGDVAAVRVARAETGEEQQVAGSHKRRVVAALRRGESGQPQVELAKPLLRRHAGWLGSRTVRPGQTGDQAGAYQ
jgi:hypothetical protein